MLLHNYTSLAICFSLS